MILSDLLKINQLIEAPQYNLNPSVPKAHTFNQYSIHPPILFFQVKNLLYGRNYPFFYGTSFLMCKTVEQGLSPSEKEFLSSILDPLPFPCNNPPLSSCVDSKLEACIRGAN